MSGEKKLSARRVSALVKVIGKHSDGLGLYLRVRSGGRASWIFIWKRDGRQQELGLGSQRALSLAQARVRAQTCRDALAEGKPPREALKPQNVITFLVAAEACLKSRDLESKNAKTRRKWERNLLERTKGWHNRPVQSIKMEDVVEILEPLWTSVPETARIFRGHLEACFRNAKARRWYSGENPAAMSSGLDEILAKRDRLDVKHHASLDCSLIPKFMDELRERKAASSKALEFLILTGGRASETLEAVWSEFDLGARVWRIPALRMKMRVEHVVPLSDRAMELLEEAYTLRSGELVFPGQKAGRPFSNGAFKNLMLRMGYPPEVATPHGFRTSMRQWMGDKSDHTEEVAEACLSHKFGDQSRRAYRRSVALDLRRAALADWAQYCMAEPVDNEECLVSETKSKSKEKEKRDKEELEAYKSLIRGDPRLTIAFLTEHPSFLVRAIIDKLKAGCPEHFPSEDYQWSDWRLTLVRNSGTGGDPRTSVEKEQKRREDESFLPALIVNGVLTRGKLREAIELTAQNAEVTESSVNAAWTRLRVSGEIDAGIQYAIEEVERLGVLDDYRRVSVDKVATQFPIPDNLKKKYFDIVMKNRAKSIEINQ